MSNPQTHHVLITGANRGLGLALATCYAERGWQVIATCRQSSHELDQLAHQSHVRIELLDVGDETSIENISRRLHDVPIDVLINNAGIYGLAPAPLSDIKAEDFMRCMQVNALGPLLVSRALMENVSRSRRRVMVNISSRLASIGANDWGGWYVYGTSKTALNRITAQLAETLSTKNITVIALHPGWVKTEMGGVDAPVSPAQSASGIYDVIDTLEPGDSGGFRDFTGATWAW